MAAKKPASADEAPIPEDLLDPLRVLYTKALNTRAAGRRAGALVAIAEALEHIVEHDDEPSVRALENLAKLARKYSREHDCYEVMGTRKLPNRLLAPERAEFIKDLVEVAENRLRKRRPASALLMVRMGTASTAAVLSHKPTAGWGDRITQGVNRSQDLDEDAEGLVVAALVGWGLTRARARAMVKSALRRSG